MSTLLIVGHSFARRLRQDVEKGKVRFDVAGSHAKCDMFGIGGLTVSRLWGKIDIIARYAPTTVILDIGTNDIRVSTSPECLARDIMEVARAIRRLPYMRVVMVMPIITRMVGCRRTPADFEQKRHRVNDIVRALLQSGQPGEVFPWKHRGMCRDCATLFNRDRTDPSQRKRS